VAPAELPFFLPGGGWAGILFNIPVIRVVIFVVFDFNTNFTFYNQINWSRCRRITPVEKGYKDTQGLSQQTSSGRSSIGDAFAGKEGMGWYGWYGWAGMARNLLSLSAFDGSTTTTVHVRPTKRR